MSWTSSKSKKPRFYEDGQNGKVFSVPTCVLIGLPGSTPRILQHPGSVSQGTFFLLTCAAPKPVFGWGEPSFTWLRNGSESFLSEADCYLVAKVTKGSSLNYDASTDSGKPGKNGIGRYRCLVKYEMNYEGEKTVLVSQSRPTDVPAVKKVPTASARVIESTSLHSYSSKVSRTSTSTVSHSHSNKEDQASRIAKDNALAENFHNKYVGSCGLAPFFCHAFWQTAEDAGNDWKEMRSFAVELIEADWTYQHKFVKKVETQVVQPDIRRVFEKALGMEIASEKRPSSLQADGLIYSKTVKNLPIGVKEIKPVILPSGDPLTQGLVYLNHAHRIIREMGLIERKYQAFPCFLLIFRGKIAELHATIHVPDPGDKSEMNVIHFLLASAHFTHREHTEAMARFLSIVKRGLSNLEKFWAEGAECMHFDKKSGYPLPCDCVAAKVHKSLRIRKHVKRNVFGGEIKVQTDGSETTEECIIKFSPDHYGLEAHKACIGSAEKGEEVLAPEIFAETTFTRPGRCHVVVMKKFLRSQKEGFVTLQEAFSADWLSQEVAGNIKKKMREALSRLHEKNLVHGDFRAPNILVSPKNNGSVIIIDFEWSGKEGEVRYPSVNVELNWPEGVGPGQHLKKEHDLHLLRSHCNDIDYVTSFRSD